MTHWNYRIVKIGDDGDELLAPYGLCEVYYTEDGEIYGATEAPVDIWLDSPQDLDILITIIGAFNKPALEFVDDEWIEIQREG